MNLSTNSFSKEENKNVRKIKISSYILAVISVFFIAAIVLLGHKWNGSRIIKTFTISGNQFLSYLEISKLLDSLIINKTQDKISLSKIQQKLNAYPFILNSTVMFSDLETVSIEITEKLPKLLLKGDSNFYFVMEDLSVYPFRKFEKHLYIPLVKNISIQNLNDSLLLNKVISFVDEANKDRQLTNKIDQIIVEKEKEECEIYLNNCRFIIKTKLKNNLMNELKNIVVFFGTEYFEKSNDKIDYIDARWNEKLYVMEKY